MTTDLAFSYNPLGHTAGVWEATPNSAGYYTASATYWPNGAPATLTALGMTTKSYGVPYTERTEPAARRSPATSPPLPIAALSR